MGNVGGGEILLILLVALMVLGPTKLPEAMRQVGRAVGEVKRLSQGFQEELKAATDFSDDEIEARGREAGRLATGTTGTGASVSTTSPLPAASAVSSRPRQVVGPDDTTPDDTAPDVTAPAPAGPDAAPAEPHAISADPVADE